MKAYTDLEQSKKLAEILPLESADMFYIAGGGEPVFIGNKMVSYGEDDYDCLGGPDILCWSLSALLGVLPDTIDGIESYCRLTINKEGDAFNISYDDILSEESIILYTEYSFIDACYEMILHLHEQKIL